MKEIGAHIDQDVIAAAKNIEVDTQAYVQRTIIATQGNFLNQMPNEVVETLHLGQNPSYSRLSQVSKRSHVW